jgi:hypothetical protein
LSSDPPPQLHLPGCSGAGAPGIGSGQYQTSALAVRKLGNFQYILIPEIINMFMTNMSDPVKAKHVLVFKLNLK